MTPISICVIAKNEQAHIGNFFNALASSLGSYPHELVFVDTGSTDDTVTIASSYVSKIHHFDWCNDFGAAKNYALSKATNRYVLFLDCDEYLSSVDTDCFERFARKTPKSLGVININNHLSLDGAESVRPDTVTRFFDKDIYHYQGAVHEQLCAIDENSLPEGGIRYTALPITIEHYGYMGSLEELRAKVDRNNAILFDMLKATPGDPYLLYQIGAAYSLIRDYENAYLYYSKGLEADVDPKLRYVQEMVVGFGYAMLETGRASEALGFEGIMEAFGQLSDFLTLMGLIYLRNGLIQEALDMFKAATCAPESIDPGTADAIPKQNIRIIEEHCGLS